MHVKHTTDDDVHVKHKIDSEGLNCIKCKLDFEKSDTEPTANKKKTQSKKKN